MQKNRLASGLLLLTSVLCLAGCKNVDTDQMTEGSQNKETLVSEENMETENLENVLLTNSGRSVVVEYIGNEMVVTDTPVVTNFYLAEGEKHGIGTEQSHERYEILMSLLDKTERMDMAGVRDALDRVSKDNFGEFESTEWSIIFDQADGQAVYYQRENYEKGYAFTVE